MNLFENIRLSLSRFYGQEISSERIQLQKTNKQFRGHLTLVVFPLLKISGKDPERTAVEIGEYLVSNELFVSEYNVVKGFLNFTVTSSYWMELLDGIDSAEDYGIKPVVAGAPLVMIEYSSPNTNKPLHLGHIRNNLLGFSLSEILKAVGNRTVKTNIVNDRGIHICKSMLAWSKWGGGATPELTGKKGDHLVGDFYVKFDREYKRELEELKAGGLTQKEAEERSVLMSEAREMLRKWESGDEETVTLWRTMNSWVYAGFDKTYRDLGVDFDKIYYESETYLDGKRAVLDGLERGIFYRRDDGSVWADLTDEGLDEKLLLRSDGTSVYMTQDIGTAKQRFDDYPIDRMVYVVGNEQNYHFQVLSLLLDRLGFSFGRGLVHFSYGMVELPEGKMKSREGTVVDADDLISEMVGTALETSEELGKLDGYSGDERERIARIVGLGALKYFILKVDPQKNMVFNPKESIDFNGNTGPFIQYTYARIQSVLRKADVTLFSRRADLFGGAPDLRLDDREVSIIRLLADFPLVVVEAAGSLSPAVIANYVYDLAKEYNRFYHDFPILKEDSEVLRVLRLVLSRNVGKVIRAGFSLLGIEVPDRM
ncbi:MAG: arginine--tRNA ligase [Dysgonamonadaceae bacterium]|nr:arginine--tRNA ligase [Dysgonamonadaceae bacterium]